MGSREFWLPMCYSYRMKRRWYPQSCTKVYELCKVESPEAHMLNTAPLVIRSCGGRDLRKSELNQLCWEVDIFTWILISTRAHYSGKNENGISPSWREHLKEIISWEICVSWDHETRMNISTRSSRQCGIMPLTFFSLFPPLHLLPTATRSFSTRHNSCGKRWVRFFDYCTLLY